MTWVEAALVHPLAVHLSRPLHSGDNTKPSKLKPPPSSFLLLLPLLLLLLTVVGNPVSVTAGSDILYPATHVITLPLTPDDWDKALSSPPSLTLRIFLING